MMAETIKVLIFTLTGGVTHQLASGGTQYMSQDCTCKFALSNGCIIVVSREGAPFDATNFDPSM